MNKETVTFEGIPGGDSECFCWEVDEETYKRFEGERGWRIEKELRESYRVDGMIEEAEAPWRLYPDDIFVDNKKVKITITIEEIE